MKYAQCRCGQVLAVSDDQRQGRLRCPACGAGIRIAARSKRTDASPAAGADAPIEEQREPGGEYTLEPQFWTEEPPKGGVPAGTWVPARGQPRPAASYFQSNPRPAPSAFAEPRDAKSLADQPSPFFTMAALFYPWVHPNWIWWLGLTAATYAAIAMIAGSLFVLWIIMRFGAFVSLLATGPMAMACLATSSYVVGSFVVVVEDTAHGDDRLNRLVELNWWETLPRLLRVLGAATATALVGYAITYPLRQWFEPLSRQMLTLQSVIALQTFPILLITNLADCSWVPIWSLWRTVTRLVHCVGYLVAFLAITSPGLIAGAAVLQVAHDAGVWVGIAVAGPVISTALMFYGHWLGRLIRQMTEE
jgi:DNA-directed RNA polymerase subunit RPC12/RpoP